jgi:biotin operon repressor
LKTSTTINIYKNLVVNFNNICIIHRVVGTTTTYYIFYLVAFCYIRKFIMSIQTKVLNVLKSGKQFTAGQIAGLFGTTEGTVVARVSELRAQGYAIYSNTAKNGKTAYRLGVPSRAMVATAFAAAGSTLFN